MQRIDWKKVGHVFETQFFHDGILIAAALFPDRTTKAIASQIGTANNDSFGAAFRLPDGRWFHPAVSRVDRVRVYVDSGMNKDRAFANAILEERETAERFLEAEKGVPHLRLLVVTARRGTIMEKKEIGGLNLPFTPHSGPHHEYNKLTREMAAETAAKVLKAIRALIDNKAA